MFNFPLFIFLYFNFFALFGFCKLYFLFIFGFFFDREEQNLKRKPKEEYAEDVKKKKLSEIDPEVGIVVAKC